MDRSWTRLAIKRLDWSFFPKYLNLPFSLRLGPLSEEEELSPTTLSFEWARTAKATLQQGCRLGTFVFGSILDLTTPHHGARG